MEPEATLGEASVPVVNPDRFPTWLAGALGFLLALSEVLLGLLSGDTVVDAIWPHAVRSLDWTMALRANEALPLTYLLLTGGLAYGGRRAFVQAGSPRTGRLAVTAAIGFVLGWLALYFAMDVAYLRGAFLLLPTLMGWTLAMLLLVSGGLPSLRDAESQRFSAPQTVRLVGVFFAAWLVMPGMPAIVGMAPSPPDAPRIGYGSAPGPYDTVQFASPYPLPAEVVAVQGGLEDDVVFSVHLTLPMLPEDTPLTSVPLAVLLHGFGYPDVNAYQAWISHLAAKGMAVAFIQYPSDLRPPGHETHEERETEGTSDFLQHTYRNLSLRAGMDHLEAMILGDNRDQRINEHLGNVIIDPSSLWVGGHSLGAAYTFLTLDDALERGWASRSLAVALEAPANRPMQAALQPNLTNLPEDTLVQISVSEDDMSVGMCPGAFHQTQFDALPEERNQLIVVRSDHYGFPRLVASHYMQTDPAHDRLSDWGFYRRIDAQADFVVAHSRNDTFTSDFAYHYLTDEVMLTNMGTWEDGTPVLPLQLVHNAVVSVEPFVSCR